MKQAMTALVATVALALVPVPAAAQDARLAQIADETNWENLSRELCVVADAYFGYNEAGEKVEDVFLDHFGITRSTPDYRDQVIAFWNANSEKLICRNKCSKKPYARVPQHFMKRVVDLRMENQIFYEFLLDDSDTWQVNVNAIEMIDGRAETLLDYLDGIRADPSRHHHYDLDQIAEFREYIVEEYGAKTARELGAS
ncbi:hypothetical protein [Croceicoccus gelatinilyticus]|uniref:hypothetical protein n=1 Tax=Croceicoccus gelatinilyticus TaxID=2835536 RepID=UPI001BCDA743|nr:hypothetical protein [Croceicoccus gelatinilyticus]MBS7668149.1 hypothetical protein [Croceicoccus gelatinilyticus]